MADEKSVTTHTVETHEEKPKRTRKARKPKAEVAAESPEVEIEVEESDDDHELGDHYVNHVAATITLKGAAKLRVMTPEEQRSNGIKFIAGEMGKKCKTPLVITFKNAKAAVTFFNLCLNAEKESEEFIDVTDKVEWFSPSMMVNL